MFHIEQNCRTLLLMLLQGWHWMFVLEFLKWLLSYFLLMSVGYLLGWCTLSFNHPDGDLRFFLRSFHGFNRARPDSDSMWYPSSLLRRFVCWALPQRVVLWPRLCCLIESWISREPSIQDIQEPCYQVKRDGLVISWVFKMHAVNSSWIRITPITEY